MKFWKNFFARQKSNGPATREGEFAQETIARIDTFVEDVRDLVEGRTPTQIWTSHSIADERRLGAARYHGNHNSSHLSSKGVYNGYSIFLPDQK